MSRYHGDGDRWGNTNNDSHNIGGGSNMHGKRWRDTGHNSNFDNNNNGNKRRRFNDNQGNTFDNNGNKRRRFVDNQGNNFDNNNRFSGRRNNNNYRRPATVNPANPNKMLFKDFLMTQPDNIDVKEAQKKYRHYETEWRKHHNEREMNKWISSRANDDVMREHYLPSVKEQRNITLSKESAKTSTLIQKLVGTEKFSVISMCKDTSDDAIENINDRVHFSENKNILFIPMIPVFITREELNQCIADAEKEALQEDLKSDDEDTRKIYEHIIQSRKIFESDPKRKPHRRFERSANIWYHSVFIEGATKADEEGILPECITKVAEAVMSKLSGRKIVQDHDFQLQVRFGRDQAPVPMPLGSIDTKMLERSIEGIIKLSNALAIRKGIIGLGGEIITESYVPLQTIVDDIKEEEVDKEQKETVPDVAAAEGKGDVEATEGNVLVTVQRRTQLINRFEVCLTYLFLVHHIDYFDFNVEYQDGGDRFHCVGKRCYQVNKTLACGARSREEDLGLNPIQTQFLENLETKIDAIKSSDTLGKAKDQLEQEKIEIEAFIEGFRNDLKEKFIKNNTVQVGHERFRCPLSNKLFRGPEFIRKHIILKFEDKIIEYQQKNFDWEIEWIKKKHSEDPNRGDFLETKLAHRIGLRSRYLKKKDKNRQGQNYNQNQAPPLLLPAGGQGSEFRRYNVNASNGNNNSSNNNNNNHAKGRLDPRARRLQSYNDVDEFAEDDLVYTR
jgi:hypothetical protein